MFFPFFKSIFLTILLCLTCRTLQFEKNCKYFLNNIVESSTRYIINLNIV